MIRPDKRDEARPPGGVRLDDAHARSRWRPTRNGRTRHAARRCPGVDRARAPPRAPPHFRWETTSQARAGHVRAGSRHCLRDRRMAVAQGAPRRRTRRDRSRQLASAFLDQSIASARRPAPEARTAAARILAITCASRSRRDAVAFRLLEDDCGPRQSGTLHLPVRRAISSSSSRVVRLPAITSIVAKRPLLPFGGQASRTHQSAPSRGSRGRMRHALPNRRTDRSGTRR